MKTFYIYLLADSRIPEEIRYVGQTIDPKKRIYDHCEKQRGKSHRACWLNKLRNEGVKPVMIILNESHVEHNISDMEIVYIRFFRDMGYDLVNTAIGGRVGNRKYYTEEERITALKTIWKNLDQLPERKRKKKEYQQSTEYRARRKEYDQKRRNNKC
jgi:hypothetical protein